MPKSSKTRTLKNTAEAGNDAFAHWKSVTVPELLQRHKALCRIEGLREFNPLAITDLLEGHPPEIAMRNTEALRFYVYNWQKIIELQDTHSSDVRFRSAWDKSTVELYKILMRQQGYDYESVCAAAEEVAGELAAGDGGSGVQPDNASGAAAAGYQRP